MPTGEACMPFPSSCLRRRAALRWLSMLLPVAFVLSPVAVAQDKSHYLRAGLGIAWTADTRFSDSDCAQTTPPALFGCQAGSDGRALGAYGDFGRGLTIELGLGHRFTPRLRGEILMDYRPDLEFDGGANFLGVSGEQPVVTQLDSLASFAVGYLDFPNASRWQPYLGAGIGFVRNRIDPVEYAFPGLGDTAATRTSGGSDIDLAWLATAGIAVEFSPHLQLDLAYRYNDLGDVRGDSGPATIVRTSGTVTLDVGATRAQLTTQGFIASLRWRF